MNSLVEALLTGKARPFRADNRSAIAKQPVTGAVGIARLGLAGDEQAELKVHGGPHMAVHLYPLQHHEWWRETLGDHPLLDDPGAFGSNLAVRGVSEDEVHIGDRFRLGSALLEISQPRQPCWKIEHRFGHKGMVDRIVETGRCGWYFRVVEEGEAQAGDVLVRETQGDERFSVSRVFNALWGRAGTAAADVLPHLADLEALTPKLRAKAESRAG